jgi:hypothetical protein
MLVKNKIQWVFGTEADFELYCSAKSSDCVCKPEREVYNGQEFINGTFGVQPGRGAQPQVSGSGARLKELTKKLATLM